MVRLEAGTAHPPLIDQEMVQLGKFLAWSCCSPWSIYTPSQGVMYQIYIKICSSRNHIRLHFLTCFQSCNPGLTSHSIWMLYPGWISCYVKSIPPQCCLTVQNETLAKLCCEMAGACPPLSLYISRFWRNEVSFHGDCPHRLLYNCVLMLGRRWEGPSLHWLLRHATAQGTRLDDWQN